MERYDFSCNHCPFVVAVTFHDSMFLSQHIHYIEITDVEGDWTDTNDEVEIFIHVFKLSSDVPMVETTDEDATSTCLQSVLPSSTLHGLWASLIFDTTTKETLLEYATTALRFSDVGVNPHIIGWNR